MRQQIDANPQRLDFWHLLEYLDLMTGLVQCQCRRQSADTGTNDHDFHAVTFPVFRKLAEAQNAEFFRDSAMP